MSVEILTKERYHVLPLNDLKPHTESGEWCACQPMIVHKENGDVVVHNAYDGREFTEADASATLGH